MRRLSIRNVFVICIGDATWWWKGTGPVVRGWGVSPCVSFLRSVPAPLSHSYTKTFDSWQPQICVQCERSIDYRRKNVTEPKPIAYATTNSRTIATRRTILRYFECSCFCWFCRSVLAAILGLGSCLSFSVTGHDLFEGNSLYNVEAENQRGMIGGLGCSATPNGRQIPVYGGSRRTRSP